MLAWIAQRDNIAIHHARNHGKQHIGKYPVDGYNAELNTVWEIQGCMWHGCTKCYAHDTINSVNHLTMQDLHQQTLEKVQFLKDSGCKVIEIWTCDIERQLAVDSEMKTFLTIMKSPNLWSMAGFLWWSHKCHLSLLRCKTGRENMLHGFL